MENVFVTYMYKDWFRHRLACVYLLQPDLMCLQPDLMCLNKHQGRPVFPIMSDQKRVVYQGVLSCFRRLYVKFDEAVVQGNDKVCILRRLCLNTYILYRLGQLHHFNNIWLDRGPASASLKSIYNKEYNTEGGGCIHLQGKYLLKKVISFLVKGGLL